MTDAGQRLSTALSDRYRMERELGAGGMFGAMPAVSRRSAFIGHGATV
jgi:hypothetical protein